MYNVVIGFGNYPTYLRNGKPGPYTTEELGLMWIKHVAAFSVPGMLKKYRLVLLLPRELLIPETLNLDLDQWGAKQRIDDNNKAQPWPVGPNSAFKQILWCYAHDKLQGPFLWCEPDCIPIKPHWLDRLFDEYERARKPFMGALVDGFFSTGYRIPKHMTGNAIYPDKPYQKAPKLLECHGTAWDVYAAGEILKLENFHDTDLIQHEIDDQQHPFNSSSVLYHPDKTGNLIGRLSGSAEPLPQKSLIGAPPVEVFSAEEPKPVDHLLSEILRACQEDKDTQRKVAYFMIDNRIVNSGHWGQHKKKLKEQEAHAAELSAPPA